MRSLLTFLLLFPLTAAAQVKTCDDLKAAIAQTYGFHPADLDDAGRAKKTAEMDRVWDAVHKNPALAPCLAGVLRTTQDTWLLFDGAMLLRAVADSAEAKRLQFDALSRIPLADVDMRTFVELASYYGLAGFDTTALGKRWLDEPNAEYYLPEHGAYHVDRNDGALFIFGAMDERYATPALLDIMRTSTGERRDIATRILMQQATPEGLRALQKPPQLIVARKPPKTTRAEFLSMFNALLKGDEEPFNAHIEKVPDGERDLVAVATPADVELLRKVRRYYIAKNNQHAIEYYNQFTDILMTLVWKPEP